MECLAAGPCSSGSRSGRTPFRRRSARVGWARCIAHAIEKLGRDVAIKVVPDAFVSDPERLARFEREARMLASLNHPHIGAIYGLEEAGASRPS